MKPEEAMDRALELVTLDRLEQMAMSYAACGSDLYRMPEIVSESVSDRLALRIAVRKLVGVI